MWQFMALGFLIGVPFELSRKLKTALRARRNLPVESPELPQPRAWTVQRDVSGYCSWRALEQDMWATQREALSFDVWHNDRYAIDTSHFRRMPKPLPQRRQYIIDKYDGRYSFGEPVSDPTWSDGG